ncbi:MAG TPA: hypothetical protein VIU12_23290 [Chryseolinea sp.]
MNKVASKKSKEGADPRYLSKKDIDRIHNSPRSIKKNEEASEYLKSVDWNEWEKVFEKAEADSRKRREEEQASRKKN